MPSGFKKFITDNIYLATLAKKSTSSFIVLNSSFIYLTSFSNNYAYSLLSLK